MAEEQDLYVSIYPEIYRGNKTSILMSQVYLLETLKRIQNLKVLTKQKDDLKKKMHKLLTVTLTNLQTIQNKIPSPKVPKIVEELEIESEEKNIKKQSVTKRDEIQNELLAIQEKLRELNS